MPMIALRWPVRLLVVLLLLAWGLFGLWLTQKRLPPGVHIIGAWQSVPGAGLKFRRDLSAADATGAPLMEQQIDGALLDLISQAREFLVLDTGVFGDLPAAGPNADRLRNAKPVATPLSEALLKAKHEQPDLQVLVLVDPASEQVGADSPTGTAILENLRKAGIAVIAVDAARLRPPDGTFSGFWHVCCRWWAGASVHGDWPNPIGLGPHRVSMGLWGETFAYQRSHRQVLIGDDGAGALVGMIFSRPLNAEAGIHSSTALQLQGSALEPLLESEFVVAQFSGWSEGGAMQARSQRLANRERANIAPLQDDTSAQARVISEAGIAETLVQRVEAMRNHDSIDVAALYLSQRDVVRSLLGAARRGAAIRVLLDPGKDGYGYRRSGFPNRQVASELVAASDGAIRVRWYRTHGEQFSPGLVLIRSGERAWLMIGTAELSGHDLEDFNLAAAVEVDMPAGTPACADALSWFDSLWFNRAAGGTEYTSDVDVYADASQIDYWEYRLLEASGASFD